MRVLVSCCDNDTGLFLWDNGAWSHLMLAHGQSIVPTPHGIVVMTEGAIKILGPGLTVEHSAPFTLDGHHGTDWDIKTEMLVTASSDQNALFWTDPLTGEIVDQKEVNPAGSHTNDIDVHRNVIYISSFHKGITALDRESDQVMELYPNQNKPHTVKSRPDGLYWCESEARRVMKDGECIAEHPGFVRGLDWFDNEMLVGISRHKYRNEGSAGFYFRGEFHGVPAVNKREVTNLYSLMVI